MPDYPLRVSACSYWFNYFSKNAFQFLLLSVFLLSLLHVCSCPWAGLGCFRLESFHQGYWPDSRCCASDGFLGNTYILGYKYDATQNPDSIQTESHVLYSSGIPRVFYLFFPFLEAPIPDSLFLGSGYNSICYRSINF